MKIQCTMLEPKRKLSTERIQQGSVDLVHFSEVPTHPTSSSPRKKSAWDWERNKLSDLPSKAAGVLPPLSGLQIPQALDALGNFFRDVLPSTPKPASPRSATWSLRQQKRFAEALEKYLCLNPSVLARHEEWHLENGIGGTKGPGSGEIFMLMHHSMVLSFEKWLIEFHDGQFAELVPIWSWDPELPLPEGFQSTNRKINNLRLKRPSWTLTQEMSALAPREPAPAFGHKTIEQFRSLDELGIAIGTEAQNKYLSYHGAVHRLLGEEMDTWHSPIDPAFWIFHQHLEDIRREWQTTRRGRKWMEQNRQKLGLVMCY